MLTDIILAAIPSLLTGIVLAVFSKKMNTADDRRAQAEHLRRKEAKLNLDLTFASAQLSYAIAMAMKRGHPNGEVEQGVETYESALAAYRKFEREQLTNSLN